MTSLSSDPPRDPRDSVALFEAWVVAHHAAVYRSAWRITRNGADAEDVAQRVYLHVLERLGRPEWTDAAAAGDKLRWLAVKTALQFRRGEANRRRREEARAMETSESASGPDLARAELLTQLRVGVARLPDELRVATVLRFQEGLTFAAMAELAGTSEPTMFERVKRALEKLRVGLAQAGHASALVELEALLAHPESIEVVAVPGGLCATLLALPAAAATGAAVVGGAAAGAATSAFAASATSVTSGSWLAAAAVVVLLGGGAAAVHAVRSNRASPGDDALATARNPDRDSVPSAPPIAAATAEPARVAEPVDGSATDVRRAAGTRMRAGDLLHCDMGLPPDATSADRMVDTVRIHGFVGDDDGRALAGVHVEASSSDGAPKAFAWQAKTESGADGAFDLRVAAVVAAGQLYDIRFEHPDTLRTQRFARVTPDADCDLARVQMRRNVADRPGEFELTLALVGPDNVPVHGAIVRMERKLAARAAADENALRSLSLEWQAGGVTDERGALVLKASRIGSKRFTINAHRVGYRDQVVSHDIPYAGASELRLVLTPGLTITGHLVPPDGVDAATFLRGAQLDAVPQSAVADSGDPYDADVAPDGRFTIRGLGDGAYRVRGRSSVFSPFEVAEIAAGRADVAFQLKRRDDSSDSGLHRAEIHGRLVDERGAPLAVLPDDVQIVALPAGWKADDPRVVTEFVPALLAPQREQTSQVLIDGDAPPPRPSSTFHVNDLDAGSFLVVVRAPGRAPAASGVVTLANGEIARDLVVTVPRVQ